MKKNILIGSTNYQTNDDSVPNTEQDDGSHAVDGLDSPTAD